METSDEDTSLQVQLKQLAEPLHRLIWYDKTTVLVPHKLPYILIKAIKSVLIHNKLDLQVKLNFSVCLLLLHLKSNFEALISRFELEKSFSSDIFHLPIVCVDGGRGQTTFGVSEVNSLVAKSNKMKKSMVTSSNIKNNTRRYDISKCSRAARWCSP